MGPAWSRIGPLARALAGCRRFGVLSGLALFAHLGASACGARSELDGIGAISADGGKPDVSLPRDATVDAPSDVPVADGPPVRDAQTVTDATADSSDDTDADAGYPEPPSCRPGGPGMTNCGDAGTASCCVSPEVDGGTFYRTYRNPGSGPTNEADPATVSSFRLDAYLVTVGRFRQFVMAWTAGYLPAAGSGKQTYLNGGRGLVDVGGPPDAGTTYETGWDVGNDGDVAPTDGNLACTFDLPFDAGLPSYATWTPSPATHENLPIGCVNLWEAYAFCIWDEAFLPSDAQRNYAAAGGSEQRDYPWGSTDPGTANRYAIYGTPAGDCYFPDGRLCDGVGNIAPVGTATLGATAWGQLDLTGELWERSIDFAFAFVDPCVDCAYVSGGSAGSPRWIRGASFGSSIYELGPSYIAYEPATYRDPTTGFRCARAP